MEELCYRGGRTRRFPFTHSTLRYRLSPTLGDLLSIALRNHLSPALGDHQRCSGAALRDSNQQPLPPEHSSEFGEASVMETQKEELGFEPSSSSFRAHDSTSTPPSCSVFGRTQQ